MKLKHIEIFGFKSFADKLKIEFGQGISGIVGPNGSGKSNIIDAIKWVLGEQSMKDLRGGGKIEDMIFYGSKTRNGLSVANVTLNIDNSSKKLPIDFSEVSITRKVYKSGESEYLINDEKVRLKDIHELFMDTGLGVDAYCFVEQGKVDRIIKAGKEERRIIIEEAAGVTKYKNKREEALRKLEKSNENILRIQDIINELSARKEILDKEVKRINQYNNYKEKLKNLELSRFSFEYQSVMKSLNENQKKSERIKEEMAKFEDEIRVSENNHNIKKSDFNELLSKISDNARNIYIINSEIIRSQEKEEALKKEFQIINQTNNDLSNQIDFYNKRMDEINKRITSLEDENNNLNSVSSEAESKYEQNNILYKEIENKLSEEKKNINEFENLLKASDEISIEYEKNIAQNNEKINYAENAIYSLEEEKQNIFFELERIKEKLTAIDTELKQKNDEKIRKRESLSLLLDENKETELKLNTSMDNFKKYEFEIFSLKKNITELQDIEFTNRSLYAGERELIKQKDSEKILGVLGELLNVTEGREKLVENLLGEKLNYLLVKDEITAFEKIKYLKDNGLGYVRLIIISRLKDLKLNDFWNEIFLNTPDNIKVILANIIENIQINEDTIVSGIYFFGGSYEKTQGYLEIETQIRNYTKRISDCELEKNNNQKNIEELKQVIDKKKEEMELFNINIKELDEEIKKIEINQAMLKNEFEIKNNIHSNINIEFEKLDSNRKNAQLQIIEINSSLEENKKKINEINQQLSEKLDAFQNQQKEWFEINIKFREARTQFENISQKIAQNKKEYEQNMNEKNYIFENITKMQNTIRQNNDYVRNNETFFNENTKNIEEKQNKISLYENENKKFEEEKKNIDENLIKLSDSLKYYNHKLNSAKEENMNTEIIISKLKQSKEDIQKRVSEDYNLDITTIPSPETSVEEESIKRVKKIIENFGAINLAAKEEYTELESRLNFLLKQQQDLQLSIANLNETIKKLNDTIKTQFLETFQVVRTNFQEIFVKLFEGGSADIQLSEEQNLLETGIDIMVAPPGKKVKTVNSLSGGEEALTAIAFLFAIFFVKPSPFYILDEVDAPLDDINIIRFLKMIKEQSDQSQFILITHNKKTMEYCDVLYGVTMEEFGVSKILSVKLN